VKIACVDPRLVLFAQKENVNVLRLDAELGVLLRKLESPDENLSDLAIEKSPAAPAVVARNSGLAAPGILMKRLAAK
jgi:hypothetical protein